VESRREVLRFFGMQVLAIETSFAYQSIDPTFGRIKGTKRCSANKSLRRGRFSKR
jgi:hypothetical protein